MSADYIQSYDVNMFIYCGVENVFQKANAP